MYLRTVTRLPCTRHEPQQLPFIVVFTVSLPESQSLSVQVTPEDVSGLLKGLKSLVERGSNDAAAVLAQVLAQLAADDSDAQVTSHVDPDGVDSGTCLSAESLPTHALSGDLPSGCPHGSSRGCIGPQGYGRGIRKSSQGALWPPDVGARICSVMRVRAPILMSRRVRIGRDQRS